MKRTWTQRNPRKIRTVFKPCIPYFTDEEKWAYIRPKIIESEISFYEGTPCWEWTKGLAGGYGGFSLQGINYKTHRETYSLVIGPIPEGYEIDHLCRNHKCCNPKHLEAVTHQINVQRGIKRDLRPPQEFCKQGHAYTEENTRLEFRPSGSLKRSCKQCNREKALACYHRKRSNKISE